MAASGKTKVALERIIGTTTLHNNCVAVCPTSPELLAYAAGSKKPKPVTCLSFSPNGKYLAVGESGHQPGVVVWDVANGTVIAELRGQHKFGVGVCRFSPNGKILASVGFEHDQTLALWDWAKISASSSSTPALPTAKAMLGTKVHSLAFSEEGTYFVTAGHKHVKFWYLDSNGGIPLAPVPIATNSPPASPAIDPSQNKPQTPRFDTILGNHAICKESKDSTFLDVVCGRGATASLVYTVTNQGKLVLFNAASRTVERIIDTKTPKLTSVSLNDKYLVCGGENGVVRMFEMTMELGFVASTPKPVPLGQDVKSTSEQKKEPSGKDATAVAYPDVVACAVAGSGANALRIVTFYSNRSIVIWDATNPARMGRYRSFQAHGSCIWGVDVLPTGATKFPEGTFVTCSADGSVRFWNLDLPVGSEPSNTNSRELLHCIAGLGAQPKDLKFDLASTESVPLGEGGVRCLRVAPTGAVIATGDRAGNVRIHDLTTFKLASDHEAHNGEVLSLAFSTKTDGSLLLASGSRDRLAHIFQQNDSGVSNGAGGFALKATLDDHSSSITSVTFATSATNGKVLITASADKSIIYRKISETCTATRCHQQVTHGTVYDVQVEPTGKSFITAGQQKHIGVNDLNTGKVVRSIKLEADAGEQLRAEIDPSGTILSISSQDRQIRLYHLQTGEFFGKVTGHSELITGLRFTTDCKRLISVAGDGCIFVWKLVQDLSDLLRTKLAAMKPTLPTQPTQTRTEARPKTAVLSASENKENINVTQAAKKTTDVKFDAGLKELFSAGQLPIWAKKGLWKATGASPVTLAYQSTLDVETEILFDRPSKDIVSGASFVDARIQGKWKNKLSVSLGSEQALRFSTSVAQTAGGAVLPYLCKLADLENRRFSLPPVAAEVQPTTAAPIVEEAPIVFEDTTKATEEKPEVVVLAASTTVSGVSNENKPRPFPETEDDQFVDPAQLEQSWNMFKGEPLDRLLTDEFQSLASKHFPQPNENRLSLSTKFLKTKAPTTIAASDEKVLKAKLAVLAEESEEPAKAGPAAPPPTTAKDRIDEEVERTRSRLRQLGIFTKPKKTAATGSAGGSQSLRPSGGTVPETSAKDTPAPITQQNTAEPAPVKIAPSAEPAVKEEAQTVETSPAEPELKPNPAAAEEIAAPVVANPPTEDQQAPAEPTDAEFTDGKAVMQLLDEEEQLEEDEVAEEGEEYEGYGDGEAEGVQRFISNLSEAFDHTLQLYQDLKQRESQRTDLVTHLYALFVQMSQKLEKIVRPTPADRTELLEKYSELLLAQVMTKLAKK